MLSLSLSLHWESGFGISPEKIAGGYAVWPEQLSKLRYMNKQLYSFSSPSIDVYAQDWFGCAVLHL